MLFAHEIGAGAPVVVLHGGPEFEAERVCEAVELGAQVRRRFGHERVAVLGHSWGGLLAAEYAIRRPERSRT
jgi:pimeloyl-ACP methyl ester carboxylesterase